MRRKSDYPRQKKQEEVENPSLDPDEPRPVVWDQEHSEDRAVGYDYEEGLQYVNSSCGGGCECGDECQCGGSCGGKCSQASIEDVPELDMSPFEDTSGYYPEGGNYHQDMPVAIAAKEETEDEFPFSLKELVERHESLEKVPFQIRLGGKVLEIVVGDEKDLYLIYEMQQQVIYGTRNLEQGPLLARMLALLIELWPTSVFEVEDVPKLRREVMSSFVDWFMEFGEASDEALRAAQAFKDSLEG